MDETGLLPLEVYNDHDLHEAELDRIFGKSWVFLGCESELSDPGDYFLRPIGNNTFIFARDESGEIHVMYNSCRHRGTEVCRAEQGNTTHFRCPYHSWTYDNSGELVGVPQKDKAYPDLDPDEWGLHEAPRVESYEGLVFASLVEDGPTLEEHLGDFTWYLDIHLKLTEGGMEVLGEPQRWVTDFDWKSGAENFSGDSYHTQSTHSSVFEVGLTDNLGAAGGSHHHDVSHVDGHAMTLRLADDDEPIFFGYPDEVQNHIDGDRLSDAQHDVAKHSIIQDGTAFPNMSFLHIALKDAAESDPATFFLLRKWNPKGPGKTEVWNWVLAPKEASRAYKKRAYKVAVSTFSPSGNFDQDDAVGWRGMASSANGTFAGNLKTNFQQGLEAGDARVLDDDEWPGPGRVYNTNLVEDTIRTFYGSWADAMTVTSNDDD